MALRARLDADGRLGFPRCDQAQDHTGVLGHGLRAAHVSGGDPRLVDPVGARRPRRDDRRLGRALRDLRLDPQQGPATVGANPHRRPRSANPGEAARPLRHRDRHRLRRGRPDSEGGARRRRRQGCRGEYGSDRGGREAPRLRRGSQDHAHGRDGPGRHDGDRSRPGRHGRAARGRRCLGKAEGPPAAEEPPREGVVGRGTHVEPRGGSGGGGGAQDALRPAAGGPRRQGLPLPAAGRWQAPQLPAFLPPSGRRRTARGAARSSGHDLQKAARFGDAAAARRETRRPDRRREGADSGFRTGGLRPDDHVRSPRAVGRSAAPRLHLDRGCRSARAGDPECQTGAV